VTAEDDEDEDEDEDDENRQSFAHRLLFTSLQ
jgi:hypothetical protein